MDTDAPASQAATRDVDDAYTQLFESSMDGVLLTSPDGSILAANSALCAMLGRTEQELVSLGRGGVVDRTDPRLPLALEERKRTGRFRGELTFLRADGTTFPAEISTAIFRDRQGRERTSMVVRDVSHRRAAEQALRGAERFARATIDALPAHIAILDQAGVIVRVNRSWRDFAAANGGTTATCDGANYLDVCDAAVGTDASEAHQVAEAIRAALAGRDDRVEVEYPCHGPDVQRWFSARASGFDEGCRWVVVSHHDITERHLAEQAVRASNEQLRALAARLQAVREEERTHVAREIHDVLAQDLTRLKIDLVWLATRLERCGDEGCASALVPRVAGMSALTDTTIRAVQRLATGLRPAVLDSLGLCAAIEWHVKDFQERSGIVCQLELPDTDPPVGSDAATAAFRILQESLTNVIRHARATRVCVRVARDQNGLVLDVRDDGCGMGADVARRPTSIGLTGMRERAVLVGGHVEIRSTLNQGTAVVAHLPLTTLEAGDRRSCEC